jgi:WD40 repeat protein
VPAVGVRLIAAAALVLTALPPAAAEEPRVPTGAVARVGRPDLRHPGMAISVAFAPGGKSFASVGDPRAGSKDRDRLVLLWDLETGAEVRRFEGHTDGVQSVAFSADGALLVTASKDKTVRLWDAGTGKEVRQFTGHADAVLAVAYSRDGKYVVSVGRDAAVRLWDVATGNEVRHWPGYKSTGTSNVAFTPDSKLAASVGPDFVIRLRDVTSGEEVRKFAGHSADCESLDFSADGMWLASVSQDRTVRLWDVAAGKEERQFEGLPPLGACVRVSPDGKTVAAGGNGRVIQCWDLVTGKPRSTCVGHYGSVSEIAFSPDSRTLASAGHDGTVRLWDVATGRQLPQSGGTVAAAVVTPDGRRLATAGTDRTLRVWDPATGKQVGTDRRLDGPVAALAVSADGSPIRLDLRPQADGADPRPVATPIPVLRRVALNPDGTIAAGLAYDSVLLWNAATGSPTSASAKLRAEVAKRGRPNAVAFIPRSGHLATAGTDGLVHLWDVRTGSYIRGLGESLGNRSTIADLAVSPDGRMVATLAFDRTVRLWETATGKERKSWQPAGSNRALEFASGGRLLAVGGLDGGVRLFDPVSGKELAIRAGHSAAVTSLQRVGDERLLVSVSGERVFFQTDQLPVSVMRDSTALVWDVSDVKPGAVKPPAAGDLDPLWADLAGDDAGKAYAAVARLAAAPDLALPLLKDRLPAAARAPKVDVARLIADLDHDDYDVRERATRELKRAGPLVRPAVAEALARSKSREVRRRAADVLDGLKAAGVAPQEVWSARGVEVLERIGTPAAKALLADWSRGPADSPLTAEARSCLGPG